MSASGGGGSARRAPRVTVLLPVRDGRAFLAEAIDSVLAQTLRDLELLVVDDGSTDGSGRIACRRGDPRVRVVRNDRPLGLVASLNRGLELARGTYVARMDADDVSLPERLSRQVDFLDAHPEVGACGTFVVLAGRVEERVRAYPTAPEDVRCRLLFETALAHPTVCLRRETFARHGLRYDPVYPHAEDYALWRRASALFPICNLGEPLLRYREHPDSVTRRCPQEQQASVARIHREALSELGLDPSEAELRIHRGAAVEGPGEAPLRDTEGWLLALRRANRTRACYPAAAFERALRERWLGSALRAAARGEPVMSRFLRSPLTGGIAPRERLRVVARATVRALRGASA